METSKLTPEGEIDKSRANMGAPKSKDTFTTPRQLKQGLVKSGLRTDDRIGKGSWTQLDRDLADGKAIIGFGSYNEQWRKQFPTYSQTGSVPKGGVPHFNTILGKTANGNYIIGDPMYREGAVEMSRDQLAVYFSGQNPSYITGYK